MSDEPQHEWTDEEGQRFMVDASGAWAWGHQDAIFQWLRDKYAAPAACAELLRVVAELGRHRGCLAVVLADLNDRSMNSADFIKLAEDIDKFLAGDLAEIHSRQVLELRRELEDQRDALGKALLALWEKSGDHAIGAPSLVDFGRLEAEFQNAYDEAQVALVAAGLLPEEGA